MGFPDIFRRGNAARTSAFCAAGNAVLAAFKLFAGVSGGSAAMVSDAVHSASDMAGSLIAAWGVTVSRLPADESHPYGHERIECLASLALGALLGAAGFGIGCDAARSLVSGAYASRVPPGTLPLAAAVVSVGVKELMYRAAMRAYRATGLSALRAEAWDHRADALSSLGALAGIWGARHGLPALEPLACAVICAFIVKAAWDILADAAGRLTDRSCDADTLEALRSCAAGVEGVLAVDMLRARAFASRLYVDVEISADAALTLRESHGIANAVRDAIKRAFPQVKHAMVHVNPA